MPKVTFLPDDRTVEVRVGENLLRAAMAAEVYLNAPCAGEGTCGRCKVIVRSGRVDVAEAASGQSHGVTPEEAKEGYVLACLANVVEDTGVEVPLETRLGRPPEGQPERKQAGRMLPAETWNEARAGYEADPPFKKFCFELSPPTLDDYLADYERVCRELKVGSNVTVTGADLNVLRKIPSVLREAEWQVTATVRGDPEQATLAQVEPGDSCGDKFALGIDVGTTTIVAELIDLNTGEAVGRGSAYNAQVSCGADVISRMVFASKGDGLTKLQELAAKTVNGVLESVFTKTGVDPGYVSHVVCAANTVMTHMFLGIDTKNIREAPHAPGANVYPWVRAGELGLDLVRDAYLTFYPCIAGYVGGDVVAGVLASGMAERESLSLLIDIGTNGEIVLGNSDWMISAATSAGPAFEGGGVKYGMRAARGAIDGVRIDAATKEPVIVTIGGVKPVGICGSGLVDLLAELFLSGVVDLKGKFNTGLSTERLRDGKDGPEYVLVWADRTAQGNDIAITQPDVDNLIRAKAAVFAGIKLLSENTGVSVADIDRVYIAGAFGNYLEVDKVVTIGLLPEIPSERFEFIGNGSLIGAELYAFSSKAKGEAEALAEKITYLELSTDPNFMNEYVSAMFLPHTEGGLFPSVAGALRERAGL